MNNLNNLVSILYDSIKEFYSVEENRKIFEAWKDEKSGNQNTIEDKQEKGLLDK